MSQNLQEIFARVEKSKSRQREIKTIYRDALTSTPEYEELNDKLKALRERKKQIEATVKEQFGSEITELEDLKVNKRKEIVERIKIARSYRRGRDDAITKLHAVQRSIMLVER